MAKPKEEKKVRGVWERVPGSGVWWVRYRDAGGRLRREKVGRKSAAIDLLNKRRNDRRTGIKLPENLRTSGIRFKELADDIEAFSAAHHNDNRNVLSRLRAVRRDFDERIADDIKPADIDGWLTKHTKKPSTSNRYRALFSLIYREALRNGKVTGNPARLVRQKPENNSVIRFLSDDEEKALRTAIMDYHPARMAELDIALGTGMRLTEQYGLTWRDVDPVRREVRLGKTKNNSGRTIPMNSVVEAAFRQLRREKVKLNSPVFGGHPRPWWDEVIEKSGVVSYRWHDNRHTFCSRLAMRGVNLKAIQLLAGHKTISMTARYAHLDDSALRLAVDSLTGPK